MKFSIDVSEHEKIENSFSSKELNKFNNCFQKNDITYLGIHQEQSESLLKSYYYIGYRWLDENSEKCIHVSPKYHGNKKNQADHLKMFQCCLNDPIVTNHLDDTYKIFFDEKWIEINENKDLITPFIILHFLNTVKNIVQHGLKKGYVKTTENLTSKIKGRILLSETLKKNHIKNRLDKTVCNYQIYTTNCIENQIIKTALRQCGKHLNGIHNTEISKLLKQNLKSFNLVETRNMSESDFSGIRRSSFYKDYQQALKLAKMIFKRFGFSLNGSSGDEKYKIPPFYINMPELFERYVEVKLRESYSGLIDGNRDYKFEWGMRPDFLLPSKKMIIDAKYKYWFDSNSNNDSKKDDYKQLSLYGRINKLRSLINISDNEMADIVFIYPKMKDDDCIELDKKIVDNEGFCQIFKLGINIPTHYSFRH